MPALFSDIEPSNLAVEPSMGFLKARETFGWREPELRAEAWRACHKRSASNFEAAAGALKTLDFRHSPSGVSLLGLVLLLEHGADDLDSPMLHAAVRLGADPNFPIDSRGALALRLCAIEGRVDAALLLIGSGADIDASDPFGPSVSELARSGHRSSRRILDIAQPA